MCLLFISIHFYCFAQQSTVPNPQNPKEQPLDKPIEVKEAPKKEEPKPPVPANSNAFVGSLPAGKTPTSSQDGTLNNRIQDIPVNLFMGTPIIGLPIYTLTEAGGATVPISLSYNASGMKGHDVSSWTGMNWTANSLTPQISRIVRGIPDEGKVIYENNDYYYATTHKGFYQHGLHADNDDENDSQPDLFFLNINGTSYKFSFDNYKKAHFYPEADIDVQVTWTPYTASGSNILTAGYFTNWIVTMPDGTKYYFDGAATESSFEMEASASKNISVDDLDVYWTNEAVTSAYYLTKIQTPFGHQTIFEYHSTQYSFYRVAEQQAVTINCTFNGIDKKINRVYVISSTLFKISNSTHVVEINKGGWSKNTNYNYRYLNNTYPAREDLDNFYNFATPTGRALHKISVYAKDDTSKVFEWKFKYDYNTGSDQSNVFTTFAGYSYDIVGYTHQKRFKLRSIEEPDGNKYTFKYYDDGYGLPSRFTQGLDHWGYLNGALGANILIGQDAFRNCANNQYGNRDATNGWSQYGTLTTMSHSTGSNVFFEYENNDARNYTSLIGGSRIKKIIYLDSISNLKRVKRYDYKQVDGKSSGFLCLKPVYHFDDKTNYSGSPNQYWYSGLYQQILSETGRPNVGYSRVKETILTGDESDSLGYTISEFLQPLTEINLVETITYNCVTQYPPAVPYPITTCDTSRYLRPWKWYPYHENTVGVPTQVATYGRNNQLLSVKSSVYTEQQLQVPIPSNIQQNYRSFRLVDKNYNFERSYYEFYNTFHITSDTTKTYSQDGTNPVVNVTTYEYPNNAKHNQLIKISTSDSYGNTLENSLKYAPDFDLGMNPNLSNREIKGIYQLQQKHIYTAVIENINRIKNTFGDTFVVNASYQNYYDKDSTTYSAGLLKSNYVLENVPRATFSEASYNLNNTTFSKDTDYIVKTTVDAYNSIGLPKQTSINFGTVAKINYDATYPTLAISQTSNVGQPSEQTVSTQYAKILYGASTQTNENGLSVSNEYYPDGKLKQQTDKDGKVLKHLQYVYRGKADSDPILNTSTAYNRIITRIPRIATTDALNLDFNQCEIRVQYLDGFGKTIENVAYKASPNQKDLITGVVDYDAFTRPKKTWLSVESTQADGSLLDTATVKSTAKSFYQDQMPYSEVFEYEASPLSRVLKSYGTGKVFRDSSKYVQNRYETANGIKKFKLFYNTDASFIGTYSDYELLKTVSTDERGYKVIEYKDKSGNIVQKDIQSNVNIYLSAAYVFDKASRIRYILPPKAYNALGTLSSISFESWSEFNENVHAFRYDGKSRVIEKKSPGIGWTRVVYNRLNEVVLSQDDDELAKANTWNYVQKDGQARTVRVGQMVLPTTYTRTYLQNLFDNFTDSQQFEERTTASGNVRNYTNRCFPSALRSYINDATWKNIYYYDDADWRYADGNSGTIADYGFQSNPYNTTAYSATNAKGLMTGGLHKIDNFGDFPFPSSIFYDDKNRPIQSIVYHDLYARNQNDIQYNFVGETLQSRMVYRKRGASDLIRTHEHTLDHVGRSKDIYYTLVEGTTNKVPRLKISSLYYDNIGRLKGKIIQPNANVVSSVQSGSWTTPSVWANNAIPSLTTPAVINTGHTITIPANTTVQAGTLYDAGTLKFLLNSKLEMGTLAPVRGAGLQVIEYAYNVRGQLRGVNLDASGNPQVATEKLFSYKLDYHENGKIFDGSIAKHTWIAKNTPQSRSYDYTYDGSNKLINAQFTGVGNENYSVTTDYDANGNLLHLKRYSKTGSNTYDLVDNLTYSYLGTGNKLQKVDDAITGNVGANDFRDVSGVDYAYTPDGKITKDNNKGIYNIKYNFLDLVSKVTFNDSTKVEYFYTSTGERRQRKVTKNGVTSYTLYDGEIVYTFTGVNTSLDDFKVSEVQNQEGRFTNGKLEYAYTDHIGNLRLSYKDSLGVAFITQSQSYDPWSNVNAGSEYQLSPNQIDRYFVSGRETDNITGNILLDWRHYDSVIGRMNSYDPEDPYENISAFAYALNTPTSHIDPDGRLPILIPIIAGAIGGGLNVATNWSKIKNPWQALGYFGTGAAGGVVSLTNPLAGGAITSAGNATIDIATGNVPDFNNPTDALLYVGKEAAVGAATSFAGAKIAKVVGPALAKLGNTIGGWFKNSFQAYAKESINTVIINGQPITTTIDVGIKATKQYVSKSLGGAFGNGINNVENVVATKSTTVYRSVSLDEYKDILKNGFKPGENSYATGKLFADKLSDAKMYSKAFDNSIIMKAKIPAGVTFEKLYGVDGLKYIYNVPSSSLRRVKVLTSFKF